MNEKTDFMILKLAGGANLRFKTREAFAHWVEEVRSSWQWFTQAGSPHPPCTSQARAYYGEFINQADSVRADPDAAGVQQFVANIGAAYPLGVPFAPTNEILVGLLGIYTPRNDATVRAIGAYIWSERQVGSSGKFDWGYISHPVCLQAIAFAASTRDKGNGIRAAASDLLTRSSEQVAELVGKAQVDIEAQRGEATAFLQTRIAANEETVKGLEVRVTEAVAAIEAVQARYEEVMRLKAPVDYWHDKAIEHRVKVVTYRKSTMWMSIAFVPILALVYVAGWLALDRYSGEHPAGAVAMTLYVAGFVGAVTAVGLWFIRIVVRLYMSQHHMSMDAEERASLLRTYLALTESGKVSDNERALVLATIFRPAPDGIVKDDGAPSFSPANLLATVLDRR